MADLALALMPVPGAALATSVAAPAKVDAGAAVADPFALLMAAATPVAANTDDRPAIDPTPTDSRTDDQPAADAGDGDASADPNALLALLTMPVAAVPIPLALPIAAASPAPVTQSLPVDRDMMIPREAMADFPRAAAPLARAQYGSAFSAETFSHAAITVAPQDDQSAVDASEGQASVDPNALTSIPVALPLTAAPPVPEVVQSLPVGRSAMPPRETAAATIFPRATAPSAPEQSVSALLAEAASPAAIMVAPEPKPAAGASPAPVTATSIRISPRATALASTAATPIDLPIGAPTQEVTVPMPKPQEKASPTFEPARLEASSDTGATATLPPAASQESPDRRAATSSTRVTPVFELLPGPTADAPPIAPRVTTKVAAARQATDADPVPAAPFDSAQTGRIAPAIGKPVSTASYRGTRMIAPGSVDDAAKAKSGEQAAALSPDEQLKTGAIHSAAAEPDISLTQVQQPLHTAGRAAARIEGTAMIVDPGSIDAVATRHLAIARDDRWLDGLARDIAATGGADSHLRFTLAPEHLGALTVDIAQGADGASVHMTTDTDAAHAILTDAQPRLAAEARAQGLNLRETSVSTGGGQTGGDSARQPQPQSMAQSSGQQGQDRRPAPQQQAAALRQQPAFSRASDESSDRDLYA